MKKIEAHFCDIEVHNDRELRALEAVLKPYMQSISALVASPQELVTDGRESYLCVWADRVTGIVTVDTAHGVSYLNLLGEFDDEDGPIVEKICDEVFESRRARKIVSALDGSQASFHQLALQGAKFRIVGRMAMERLIGDVWHDTVLFERLHPDLSTPEPVEPQEEEQPEQKEDTKEIKLLKPLKAKAEQPKRNTGWTTYGEA